MERASPVHIPAVAGAAVVLVAVRVVMVTPFRLAFSRIITVLPFPEPEADFPTFFLRLDRKSGTSSRANRLFARR